MNTAFIWQICPGNFNTRHTRRTSAPFYKGTAAITVPRSAVTAITINADVPAVYDERAPFTDAFMLSAWGTSLFCLKDGQLETQEAKTDINNARPQAPQTPSYCTSPIPPFHFICSHLHYLCPSFPKKSSSSHCFPHRNFFNNALTFIPPKHLYLYKLWPSLPPYEPHLLVKGLCRCLQIYIRAHQLWIG